MILHTGLRTDIPAFYPEWLANRIKEGFALVRNPFNPNQITKYRISPDIAAGTSIKRKCYREKTKL